jgi:aldehyde dehydrogenase (NAD+)
MKPTTKEEINTILSRQQVFFATHQTNDIRFRIDRLNEFKSAILTHERRIADALWTDLHKSYEEAYLTEIGMVLQEVNHHIKNLSRWAQPKRVRSPFFLLPARSSIRYEPLGVSLIIAPWNYPFQLLMNPLVGAISAGCCSVLKPSPYTPAVSQAMAALVAETFDDSYIALTQGDRNVNALLLEAGFDSIFFTGSPQVGKIVMEAASKQLIAVVLELGGKSPCIVDSNANLDIAAKRIVWGKTINAGQTCIAPDYLFAHASIKDELIRRMIFHIEKMFGKESKESKYYPRIVNQQAMKRLQTLMQHGDIVYGGEIDEMQKYIAPTIIDGIKPEYPIMQEEIFGPLLPVMTFEDINDPIRYINTHEKPLALYYFGRKNKAKLLAQTSSGGVCINDTLLHAANHYLPFGGVGNSGLGKYHGVDSFLSFSNRRAIVSASTHVDLPMKYAPFKYFGKMKRFLR